MIPKKIKRNVPKNHNLNHNMSHVSHVPLQAMMGRRITHPLPPEKIKKRVETLNTAAEKGLIAKGQSNLLIRSLRRMHPK